MTRHLFLSAILYLASSPMSGLGCDVPVFRYALERWESDPFQLVVFNHGPLAPVMDKKLTDSQPNPEDHKEHVNWKVTLVDVDKQVPALWAGLWQSMPQEVTPAFALCTPEWRKGDAALYSGALNDSALALLGLSPKRKEILGYLLKGTSVVWLMVETKDKARNEALLKTINDQSERLTKEIIIPAAGGRGSPDVRSPLPIEVSFAQVHVQADDPAEKVLIRLLTNDVAVSEPMLFPLFGRARALAAMKSSTVDADLVEETARFLCGACSCQVKAQNPGFDLLAQANWDSIFGDQEPPPTEKEPRRTAPIYVPIPGRK